MRDMKVLLGLLCSFLVLGHGTALAQIHLSDRQGSTPARLDNCFGAWTNRASNERYQVEWPVFKSNGQGIHTFANGERYIGGCSEDVVRLRVESFDLMLLDMEMPALDGLGVLKVVKSTPKLSYSPVIIIYSAGNFDRIVECIQVGAEDYLPKPFNAFLLRARGFSSLEKNRLLDLDREQILKLQREKEMLHIEQMKSEKMMLNILPKTTDDCLKKGEENIAGSYSEVTVLFSDLVGFTKMSAKKTAPELVKFLNDIFSEFDKRDELLGLEKTKTIGGAYMAVGGSPISRSEHAEIVADKALGMFQHLADFNQPNQEEIQIRIGIHSGPVVGGVIGFTKFFYDLWANTVNIHSRMASTSENGRV